MRTIAVRYLGMDFHFLDSLMRGAGHVTKFNRDVLLRWRIKSITNHKQVKMF